MKTLGQELQLFGPLSSPRAKRAGPKGPRAESARAVTGRRNSHRWVGGRLFEPSAGFFYGNSCNFGTKSWVVWQKSDFWAKNRNFGPKKRHSLFNSNHVLATTEKSCSKKKGPFAQIIKGGNVILGDFFGVRPIFRPKTTFRPNVKTPVSP